MFTNRQRCYQIWSDTTLTRGTIRIKASSVSNATEYKAIVENPDLRARSEINSQNWRSDLG